VIKKHGGNVYQIARRLGIPGAGQLIDFSANINPLGFSTRVKKILPDLSTAILNYPDHEAHDFIHALSDYHRLPAANFAAGNGSTEFIYLLPHIIRPKSVLIVAPTFTEYENSYCSARRKLFFLKTREEHHFAIQPETLLSELKRSYGALYLCNPGSPSGALTPLAAMEDIIGFARRKGTAVILDETFMDFAEAHSSKHLIQNHDNLYILRSMTKFFGLPGLRIGYAVSSPKNIERIRKKQLPWSVNAFAQRAGAESLKDGPFIQKSITYIRDERNNMVQALEKIPHLAVFRSATNYLLLKLHESSPVSADGIAEHLLARGIVIRACEDFNGLNKQFIRIAVKKRTDNQKLILEFNKLLR